MFGPDFGAKDTRKAACILKPKKPATAESKNLTLAQRLHVATWYILGPQSRYMEPLWALSIYHIPTWILWDGNRQAISTRKIVSRTTYMAASKTRRVELLLKLDSIPRFFRIES